MSSLIVRDAASAPADTLFAGCHPLLRDKAPLITSLAYVDADGFGQNAAVQAAVSELIEDEMNAMPDDTDYLAHRPLPALRLLDGGAGAGAGERGALVAAELSRIAAARPLAPLDDARYKASAPAEESAAEPKAWEAALDNARAQLEHQRARLLNLELMTAYGDAAHAQHASDLGALCDSAAAAVRAAVKTNDSINLKRKAAQEAVVPTLRRHEGDAAALQAKNQSIEYACAQLERDVKRLRTAATEAGLR